MALSESALDEAKAILRLLEDEGLPQSDIVTSLVLKEIQNGPERSWFRLLNVGEFVNEHLIYGALSEMTFPFGTFIAPAFIALEMFNVSKLPKGDERKKRTRALAGKLKPTFRGHSAVTYFVPFEINVHWGLCMAEFREDTGIVYLGDSKGTKSDFLGLAHILADVMRLIFSEKSCKIMALNLILEKLKFVTQKDGYSCGFYVIAAIASYAKNLGTLEGYGFAQKSSVLVIDVMRTQATKCYYQRVLDAYESYQERNAPAISLGKPVDEFSEYHVFRFIESNCFGHVFPDNEHQRYCMPRAYPFIGPPSERLVLEDPKDYISTLNLGGAKFQKCKNYTPGNRKQNLMASDVTYSCQREKGTCPALVYIYHFNDGRIIGERVKLHSHAP